MTLFSRKSKPDNSTEAELRAAHQRIDLLSMRLAQVEHYLGMRRHKFDSSEARWHFQQVKSDVRKNAQPRERHTQKAA